MSERNVQIENGRWAKKNFWEREFRDIAEKIFEEVEGLFWLDGHSVERTTMVETIREVLFKELGMFMPFAGMVEELGELAHALLKKRQGIRTNQDHDADARDAYGDLRIFGYDLCNRMNWVDGQVVEETWDGVVKRDWTKNPETGAVHGDGEQCTGHVDACCCPRCVALRASSEGGA